MHWQRYWRRQAHSQQRSCSRNNSIKHYSTETCQDSSIASLHCVAFEVSPCWHFPTGLLRSRKQPFHATRQRLDQPLEGTGTHFSKNTSNVLALQIPKATNSSSILISKPAKMGVAGRKRPSKKSELERLRERVACLEARLGRGAHHGGVYQGYAEGDDDDDEKPPE